MMIRTLVRSPLISLAIQQCGSLNCDFTQSTTIILDDALCPLSVNSNQTIYIRNLLTFVVGFLLKARSVPIKRLKINYDLSRFLFPSKNYLMGVKYSFLFVKINSVLSECILCKMRHLFC